MTQQKGDFMAKNLSLKNVESLKALRTVDEKLLSYNIEMTEVTGGTFWKAYTDGQIEGTEGFPLINFGNKGEMHQWYDPIDSTNPRLIKLAKELGKCWIRFFLFFHNIITNCFHQLNHFFHFFI